jgi:hypothetical protein
LPKSNDTVDKTITDPKTIEVDAESNDASMDDE